MINPYKKRLAMFALAAGVATWAQAQGTALPLAGVSASNVPANTADATLANHWSADTSSGPQWIQYSLGGCYNVTGVGLAWYNGGAAHYNYSIQTSVDGAHWTTEFSGASDGASSAMATTSVAEIAARYVRVTSTGSDAGPQVGLIGSQVLGSGAATCPAWDLAPVAQAPTQPAPAYPGQNFSLGGYTLQLPTGSSGSVDTKSGSALSAGYSNPYYFYSDTDGAMVMMDPRVGWGTSGSTHPRTEFRENATWTTGGTNILGALVQVTKIPSNTAIAQIFQGTGPSKPLCELQYGSNGNVKLFLESTNQGGSSTTTTVTNVPVGTRFWYSLKLAGRTITVTVNGVTRMFTMDASFVGERFYFKAGNYDQSATLGTPQTTPGTVVRFYGLAISHKGTSYQDVGGGVKIVQSGLTFNRFSSQYSGTVTFTNTGSQALAGPLQFVLRGLTDGVALAGKSGDQAGSPYMALPGSGLPAGASVTVTTTFNDAAKAAIAYTPALYSGAF